MQLLCKQFKHAYKILVPGRPGGDSFCPQTRGLNYWRGWLP